MSPSATLHASRNSKSTAQEATHPPGVARGQVQEEHLADGGVHGAPVHRIRDGATAVVAAAGGEGADDYIRGTCHTGGGAKAAAPFLPQWELASATSAPAHGVGDHPLRPSPHLLAAAMPSSTPMMVASCSCMGASAAQGW